MNLPKLLLVVLVLTAVCCATAGARVLVDRPPDAVGALPRPPRPVAIGPAATAAALLERWDASRAAVWAHGRPHELAALYAPGSPAARSDLRMLRAWRHRGLRVTGMRTQLLAVAVVHQGPARWVLRVTDRLAAGSAVLGSERAPLPRDQPSSYTVVLRRVGAAWRVASVRRTSPD